MTRPFKCPPRVNKRNKKFTQPRLRPEAKQTISHFTIKPRTTLFIINQLKYLKGINNCKKSQKLSLVRAIQCHDFVLKIQITRRT